MSSTCTCRRRAGESAQPGLCGLDSPPPAPQSKPKAELTVRTGWTFTWDVRRSQVIIKEGANGEEWKQSVGELPPNVQDIIAQGGLEKWVGKELATK